ncbi:phage tail protein [Pseudomonas sp. URIL14HWK12:I7]|uniref:phage tail protein n=1 Tax=Pseudomonas sp. URIL14HWK12:I7 TaxID=1283285 RepID=UPI0004AEAFE2|nr:phage tail protein [Pseudomonas sp. URIL14HWK12:I7]
MTDQNSQFFAILTAIGKAKQANADALGIPWTFAQMGVGDANDTDPIPSEQQTHLINERRRAPLNQLSVDPANPNIIVAEQVIPENVGGWWIREVGLYDADGDLVAVANCAPSFKPLLTQGSGRTQVVRMNLIVSNTANVELKIDPSVVLATRNYVDSKVREELYKLDSKQSVRVATTGNIALTGLQVVDGVTLLAGDRVLVKNQTAAKDNGIYVAASSAWQRAPDADSSAEVTSALLVSVEQGSSQADTRWQLVTDGTIVLGTTTLTFQNVTQGYAPINSPALTGTPTAPTVAGTDNSTQIATSAAVRAIMAQFGLGSTAFSYAGNIDTLALNGIYMVTASTTGTKPLTPGTSSVIPNGTVFHLERGSSNMATQWWDSLVSNAVPITCMRTRNSAGAWSSWEQVTSVERVRAVLDTFGLGADAAKIPLITDFSADIKPGLYRAFTLGNAGASIGGPPETSEASATSMTVLVGGGYVNPGYKTFLAIINFTANGPTRAYIGHKVAAGEPPVWNEIAQTTHLPYRAKILFKTAGVYQWTVPANVWKVFVEVRGGGGSGAFGALETGAGGGGAGGFSTRLVSVTPGSVITVTVGAGGAYVTTANTVGNPGGTSSFGSHCSATGGSGGSISGGAGAGYGSGGDFNGTLGPGNPPVRNALGSGANGGAGGGGESIFAAVDTSTLTLPGMGGGGRVGTRSQAGADGCVFITC